MQIRHIVKMNSRLSFKDSAKPIQRFMEMRAQKYQIEIAFCSEFPDKNSLKISGIYLFSDMINPFSDYDEILNVLKQYSAFDWTRLQVEGLVPGTGFVDIFKTGGEADLPKTYYSGQQARFNLQINIFKYKRLKVFLRLLGKIKDLHTYSVEQFASKLESKEIFELVISYGEDIEIEYFDHCPVCRCKNVQKLYQQDSQPFLGFITKNSSFYTRCLQCEVIYLNPCPKREDIPRIYDEFDRQDFAASLNFPYDEKSQRGNFLEKLKLPEKSKSLDMGGGIGKFSQFLKKKYPAWDVTHSDFEIKQYPELEKMGIQTRALDFTSSSIGDSQFDLITMWEVIEHIHPERLEFVFQNIARALVRGGMFVFSTPNFDSSLCKALDFYSACPPFHTFVFSETWLTHYFSKHADFEISKIGYCSDFLDDLGGWMKYGQQTSPSISLRGMSEFVSVLSENSKIDKELMADSVEGTEIIYCLKRK
ncbi:MAG: class I SAM-dependent methyltransferase [Bacteriovoracaceae bacterium]|nr:class I SAM-dependent methyltransferase [Bacteriovoracaceae bacterium]